MLSMVDTGCTAWPGWLRGLWTAGLFLSIGCAMVAWIRLLDRPRA
jgi:hypothetical protein